MEENTPEKKLLPYPDEKKLMYVVKRARRMGAFRKELIDHGFTEEQAYFLASEQFNRGNLV